MADPVGQYHVLLVESTPEVARDVRSALVAAKMQVTNAPGGTEALALAAEIQFAVAIVGTRLRDMTGSALVRELAARQPNLPCVALASTADPEHAMELAGMAVFGYLVRPVSSEQLVSVVSRVAQQQHLVGQVEEERLHSAQLLGMLQTIDTIQDRVNNPLQSLVGYAELLRDAVPQEMEEARFYAECVMEGGRRIADAVTKLRQVRRPATQRWSFGETLDLDAAIAPAVERRTHPRHVSVMLARLPSGEGRRWFFVEDISQGGCAISSLGTATVPDLVEVELADPETGETFWCEAERVWNDRTSVYAGLRFVRLDPRLVERLPPEEGDS